MGSPRLPVLLLAFAPGLLAQAGGAAAGAPPRTGFFAETIRVADQDHRYVVFLPPGHSKDRRWPLIVFLNGAGECGTDGWKQVSAGLGPAILDDVANWPFVVLFPQKPDRASAWEDHDAVVTAMLDKARFDYSVEPKQVFLTGLSQGGHGTWVLGARHPERWAAIAPVCGYGDPKAIAPELKNLPIWCFHGEDDKAVPVKQSKDLCAAVEAAGGHAELSLYPRVGHNSWDKAYREEPLADWFLMVTTDRIGASYIARPEQATRATITVRRETSSDGGPSHGVTTATLEFGQEGHGWSLSKAGASGTAAQTDATRKGTLDRREASELLLQRLRALLAGGVFRLADPVLPAPRAGTATASTEFTVDIVLDGKPGLWQWHRSVPRLAELDPRFTAQIGALRAFVEAIEARR